MKFKAVFEYTGDTLTSDTAERPVIGTAMCKVPDPYYFHEGAQKKAEASECANELSGAQPYETVSRVIENALKR